MGVKTFLIEPTGVKFVQLMADWATVESACPANSPTNRHFGRIRLKVESSPDYLLKTFGDTEYEFECEHCHVKASVKPDGASTDTMFRRVDTGEEKFTIRAFGPGAMWYATWYKRDEIASDGRPVYGWDWDNQYEPPLMVTCPNGHDWVIDSRASNCTMKDDRTHRCWIRHGLPPSITVDKNGTTCAAGAGSIQAGDYHGFLRNGEFT